MNLDVREMSFNVRIVGLKELNEHAKAEIYRSFISFIEQKSLEYKFLVAETELITKEGKDERS